MPRALWKGAISFGLVHIPVALFPAARSETLDFDWLDRRNMAAVGYKRVNKETGREVPRESIVRGLKHRDGRYVILTDEEIRAANVKSTQTVDIVSFVEAGTIDMTYFDTPYFLAPTARGGKVYALLREALKRERKVGIALVVIQTRQHLAALIPGERALLLNTLRWANELRPVTDLDLPSAGAKAAGIREQELKMAVELVRSMSAPWKPEQYKDRFRNDILKLVDRKVAKGQLKEPLVTEAAAERPKAQVIDLADLLKQSLGKRKPAAAATRRRKSAKSPARRKQA